MPATVLETWGDPSRWTTRAPDGGASERVRLTTVEDRPPSGDAAVRLSGTDAVGHAVELALAPAVDLRARDDLLLWVRGPADGQPLEVRLGAGGATLAVGGSGNRWVRQVPTGASWQPVPLSLADLPPGVRRAADRLRVTLLAPGVDVVLGAVRAVRHSAVSDLDEALRVRFDGLLEIDGTAVRAVVAPADGPAGVHVRITHETTAPAPDRARAGTVRTDHTGTGFALRPAAVPVDLAYAVEVAGGGRAERARVLDAVLGVVAAPLRLLPTGLPVDVEWMAPVAGTPAGAVRLRAHAWVRPAVAPTPAVPPYAAVTVEVDQRASA